MTKSATTLAKAEKALTAYGLAKSGSVTARFHRSDRIPLALLCTWMEESYQAVAPKGLVAQLAGGRAVGRTGRARQK
jgi:hypothetical protein